MGRIKVKGKQMKYYIKDNQIQSYKSEGSEEYLSPIHPDGKIILHKHEALEYDSEGNITNPEVVAILEAKAKVDAKNQVKVVITKAIDTMRVEVDGVGYDGDEQSQDRMNRAIQTLVGDEPISWKMYDNSEMTISQTELGKALRSAGIMMSRLWFCTSVEAVEAIVAEDAVWQAKYETK